MVRSYIKIFLNNSFRNKTYTIINLSGLAIAMAVSMLIFLYVKHEYSYNKHISNRSRIYRLENRWAKLPSLPGHVIAQESKMIDKVVRISVSDFTLGWKHKYYKLNNFLFADSTFFSIFNFEFIAGNPATALQTMNSVVLTESFSKKVFGNKNPVNELILLDEKNKFIVTGVIKDPELFQLQFNAVATIYSMRKMYYEQVLEQFDSWQYYTYLLAKPGYSKEELTKNTVELLNKYGYNPNNDFFSFRLTGLNELYFSMPLEYENITLHGNKPALFILLSIAIFILIIAAINFINLTISRGYSRAREVGIRKISGSEKKQLIFQFILETIIIVLIALFISFLLVESVKPLYCNLIGKKIDINILYSLPVFVYILSTAVIFGITTGLYPSLFLSSFNPLATIKGKISNQYKALVLREGLIVFQLAISVILIIATFQIFNQMKHMNKVNLGFKNDHVIYLPLNDELKKQLEPFKANLLKQSGVLNVSYSSNYPGTEWPNYGGVIIDGKSNFYKVNSIDPDYFETLGIEIIEGRNFSPDSKADYNATFLVNETAVKNYQLGRVIGKFASNLGNGSKGVIIGVVKDFHYQSLHHTITPVLLYFDRERYRFVNLKISSKNIKSTISHIEHVWNTMCPAYPFEYHFLDEAFQTQYLSDERFGILIGISSILAIFIACLGILGLAIFSTEQRTKEIGVRKVNGSSAFNIIIMLSRDFTKWIITAFIIACPIAYYTLTKWLENFAYKTDLKWWIFILSGIIAFFIALTTVIWQSWKAANKNPVEALRYE